MLRKTTSTWMPWVLEWDFAAYRFALNSLFFESDKLFVIVSYMHGHSDDGSWVQC